MEFHLSPERIAAQTAVREALERACPPVRRREVIENGSFDRHGWQALADLHLAATAVPKALGGEGRQLVDLILALEEIGRYGAPGPYAWHSLAAIALADGGDARLRERILPSLLSGRSIATLAIDNGCRPSAWLPQLNSGALCGRVAFVPNAVDADIFVVGVAGGELVLVEKNENVVIEPIASSDNSRPCSVVKFENASAHKIGDACQALRLLDAAAIALAADALGGAQACLEMSVGYAKTRRQFGRVIGSFQAVKHELANMVLNVEPARALLWHAAHAWDLDIAGSSRLASMAKAHIADRFTDVTRSAVQLHGGIGYTWDHSVQIWFGRALFDSAFLGTPREHRQRAVELAGWLDQVNT